MTDETKLIADLQSLCRTAVCIAERCGTDTNWDAFLKKSKEMAELGWKHLHKVGYYDEMEKERQRMLDESES